MNAKSSQSTAPAPGVPRTVAEALGQMVWVLSQSPLHREMRIRDVESFMPALVNEQFRIFRFGPMSAAQALDPKIFAATGLSQEGIEQLPLGFALWARASAEAESKLEKGERLTPQEWRSGDRLWLVELVAPFATPENKLIDAMLRDLMQGPFRNEPFNLHRIDAKTGRRDRVRVASHVRSG